MENFILPSSNAIVKQSLEDEADFGDFQTCSSSMQTNLEHKISSNVQINLLMRNMFELDLSQFKQFRKDFEEQLINYFPSNIDFHKSNLSIRSQEDIINDCPIWYNLTGSFNTKPALNFHKSVIFKKFKDSLKFDNKKNNGIKYEFFDDLPANAKKRNNNDEEDIANDLDMHSLIIGSFETTLSQNPPDELDADQVIKEIESLYFSQAIPTKHNNNNNTNKIEEKNDKNQVNSLLSLNASSLLDAALKTWHVNSTNEKSTEQFYDIQHSILSDPYKEMYEETNQFHSLPSDLNSDLQQQIYNNDSLNNSLLLLKASNVVLNVNSSKLMNSNHNENNDFFKCHEDSNEINNLEEKEMIKKLYQLSIVQLNELYMELEQIIQIRSEVLIQELALRDELEFEKEQKNTFISLLLSVQNKRRHCTAIANKKSNLARKVNNNSNHHRMVRRNSSDDRIKLNSNGSKRNNSTIVTNVNNNNNNNSNNNKTNFITFALDSIGSSLKESILPSSSTPLATAQKTNAVYLTTVIPYNNSMIPIDLSTLQILIKLLKALNEDSPTVPALLTDYILKVICPS